MGDIKELCVRCDRDENQVPILLFQFRGQEVAICSSCLPVLIHKPHTLGARLDGADSIEPGDHSH
jgi:hypothetical protein